MDALQMYSSSDSEDEDDHQPESSLSENRGMHVIFDSPLTQHSKLPQPDLDFDFSKRKSEKSTSKETTLHSLLPWAKSYTRNEFLGFKKRTDKPDTSEVGSVIASVSSKNNEQNHMNFENQHQIDKTNDGWDSQDNGRGFYRSRPQQKHNHIHHVVHPHQFGPQKPQRAGVVSSSSLEPQSVSSHLPSPLSPVDVSSHSRGRTLNAVSGTTGQSSAGTKRVAVTQPYIPKRLCQARHEPAITDSNAVSSEASQSKLKDIMSTTLPMIACQMDRQLTSKLPRHRTLEFHSHTGPVTHIRWCVPQHSHLLLSSSMDKTVRIWNGIGKDGRCLQTLNCHRGAVKDVQWGEGGRWVLSCGFDKSTRLCDAESGKELQVFDHPSYATCIKTNPDDPSIFITGTYDSSIFCCDIRTGNVEREYKGKLGQILDVEFLPGCDEFVSSCDVVSRDSANRTIMVWDLRTTAVVSNQLYHEKYTCPCLKTHPSDSVFVAQSNANYIALFSTARPYKLNKFKRYEDHQLEGYHIGCDFSPDGVLLFSGSSDGKVYVYDYQTARNIKVLQHHSSPCTDVACHPVLPGVMASCAWDGSLTVWQ